MNLSHKRIAEIRKLVSAGIQLGRTEAEDLLGHNDHLTELCEARARLVLRSESESETLRGLYQMHKQTETREMRDLKAELAGLKTGYEAYERVNAELRAECEKLRKYGEEFASLAERRRERVEALRKDAERYRWLLKNASVILDKKAPYQAETGFIKFDTMPGRTETESAIDAAMGKGEQS